MLPWSKTQKREEEEEKKSKKEEGMANPTSSYGLRKVSFALLLFFFETHLVLSIESSWRSREVKRGCSGGGDCLLWEEEMEMDSEINRRLLYGSQGRYISYQALRGDAVPCSRPGTSYYSCHAVTKANPYARGCGIITGCARDMNP